MLQVMAQEGPREEDGGSMDSRVRQRDRDNRCGAAMIRVLVT